MDFTLKKYLELLDTLLHKKYSFQTFEEYLMYPAKKVVLLRHDVDKLPGNSLQTAILEAKLKIKGTYYFRIVEASNHPKIIKKIANLGHEIGYHYEDLAIAKGDVDEAVRLFQKHLTYFRQYYPVKTICMHGSPLSRYDNRNMWGRVDYKDYDLLGEPYFDIDFTKVMYLTDTGRRWNGDKYSLRDKPLINSGISIDGLRNTDNVIEALNRGLFSNEVMFTVHPQRWTNHSILWAKELLYQNLKNLIKRYLIAKKYQ